MPKIRYQELNFKPESLALIQRVNSIVANYHAAGYDLTLRQVFYQLVSKAVIANNQKSYNNLGNLINNARLAGLVDWNAIVDRTRELEKNSHWDSPQAILKTVRDQFRIDRWANQPRRVEVWIEKDALKGVISRVCEENDVPYFSCRGYTSQSEMWAGAMRLREYARKGQTPLILHLGDHDPSGKDMTRDITDRMSMFMGGTQVDRLALNWNQIEQYQPPENPAKLTDSRSQAYVEEFGDSSWELDALEPDVITELIQTAIDDVRDPDLWEESGAEEDAHKRDLAKVHKHWDTVSEEYLSKLEDVEGYE